MKWLIYIHTNKISGDSYIGLTKLTLEIRLKQHLITDSHFGRALRKYGVENFESSILKDNIKTKETAAVIERFYISMYDTFNKGYNQTTGGECLPGYTRSEESILRHLQSTDRVSAEKTRQNTILKKYGGKSPMCSKEISDKHKAKLNHVDENGLTGYDKRGKSISKALKGSVGYLNIKTNQRGRISREEYDSKWWLVGTTAKYKTLYLLDNVYYDFKINNSKTVKITVDTINNNFDYYDSIIVSSSQPSGISSRDSTSIS